MEEWVSHPLAIIENHFNVNKLDEVPVYFKEKWKQTKIPLVTLSQYLPSSCTLVRYRGMIQDQFDPEFYLKVFSAAANNGDKILLNGMYKENLDLPEGYQFECECSNNVTDDRQTLYVVPIPGETPWVQQKTIGGGVDGCGHIPSYSNHLKRSLDEDKEIEMDTDREEENTTYTSKKQRHVAPVASETPSLDTPIILNHPLPDEKRLSCLVKVYDENIPMLLNSTMEFTGILNTDLSLVHFEGEDNGKVDGGHDLSQELLDPFSDETAAERRTRNPPPSLIPRLHCILATPLNHSNPLLSYTLPSSLSKQDIVDIIGADIRRCHDGLLDLLTTACYGDSLVAEYLLLHLVSSVYSRNELMALGKFSLNISNCPSSDYPHSLYQVLQQLVTKAHFYPLSLDNLNSSQFVPFKDYSDNRLHTGLLQLSNGTHLVIDEMAMSQGQLNEKGVVNLTALGGVVQWQKVKYDFKFHTHEFNCDLPVLVLSEGKSIISTDCHIPLHPISSHNTSITSELLLQYSSTVPTTTSTSSSVLDQIRCYLTLCRMLKYDLQPDIQKVLEEDFVQMRRTDSSMNAETFHSLLSLSRLVAISNGDTSLSLEQWEHAKRLRINRTARLAS